MDTATQQQPDTNFAFIRVSESLFVFIYLNFIAKHDFIQEIRIDLYLSHLVFFLLTLSICNHITWQSIQWTRLIVTKNIIYFPRDYVKSALQFLCNWNWTCLWHQSNHCWIIIFVLSIVCLLKRCVLTKIFDHHILWKKKFVRYTAAFFLCF